MSNESLVQLTNVEVERRSIIRALALGLTSMGVLDLEAAQHVHAANAGEKAAAGGPYKVKTFQAEEYKTLRRLCELIVPKDDVSGSALDAGAPEFIDLLCSQNQRLADIYHGGLAWFDAQMRKRVGNRFVEATATEQTAMLDTLVKAEAEETARRSEELVYQRTAIYKDFSNYTVKRQSDLGAGVKFFDWVRKMTVDAFYTSPLGVKDLGYKGNGAYSKYTVPAEALEYAMKRSPFKAW
ncbi:MAG: gluconate 2-dehydrogenase subunit 3 family protein [Acidobacteria bacterium]|nr:gluconate 2-dehydrogenase subunit 3 family protein [Acidobacteriota bacterium]